MVHRLFFDWTAPGERSPRLSDARHWGDKQCWPASPLECCCAYTGILVYADNGYFRDMENAWDIL
jgi:hypothetical protein